MWGSAASTSTLPNFEVVGSSVAFMVGLAYLRRTISRGLLVVRTVVVLGSVSADGVTAVVVVIEGVGRVRRLKNREELRVTPVVAAVVVVVVGKAVFEIFFRLNRCLGLYRVVNWSSSVDRSGVVAAVDEGVNSAVRLRTGR